jgi:hypothetical protein
MIPAPIVHTASTALKVYGVFCLAVFTVALVCAGRVVLTDAWKEWRNPK